MVSNPGYFSQMASGGALTQVEDGVDNPHTGLIKALSLGMGGNYPISGFDATSVTATTATIANGVIFRDGSKVSITGGGITLSTTYTTGYHLLVARASGIVLINPTAVDKVPEYASGDVVIGIFAHTGTNPMSIQYLSIDKTANSLSIGYDSSGYTEAGTITGNANGVLITGTSDVTLDGANDRVYIKDATNNTLKTVTPQQIRDLAPTTSETLQTVTDSGATTTNSITANSFVKTGGTSSEFLKADGSVDSNVYLTTESDTLQSITDRGRTTTWDITIDGLVNNGKTVVPSVDPITSTTELAAINYANSIYYITASLTLADGMSGQVIQIKNVAATQVTINTTSNVDGAGAASDQRRTGATQITLESMEGITLQYVNDVATVTPGWYILDTDVDTDTDTGITDIVEDTTPQLGGNLDLNSQDITGTGNINITGDINCVTLTATKLATDTKTTSTLTSADAGKYLFVTAASQTITLPASHSAGEQYSILANGNDVTLDGNGNNMNGSASSITITAYNGVTCISDGTNWIVLGA